MISKIIGASIVKKLTYVSYFVVFYLYVTIMKIYTFIFFLKVFIIAR